METHDELVEKIMELFKGVALARQGIAPVWLEVDLSMAQVRTLMVLSCEGRSTVGKLADRLSVSLPTASHLVDRLVHADLAERAEDPSDRRRMLVRLTQQGEDLAGRLRQGNQEPFRLCLTQLSDEDLAALCQGLQALVRVMTASTK
ncbi:MAG TPA: MarR family transcriptional regulator [Nitrolancea sp.]|nr:MarR family transcriptional regulator [Nitrolancea sp.]